MVSGGISVREVMVQRFDRGLLPSGVVDVVADVVIAVIDVVLGLADEDA
jgi:hypothetical protein